MKFGMSPSAFSLAFSGSYVAAFVANKPLFRYYPISHSWAWGAADDHFAHAIEILQELEMPERLRDCHMEYAQILGERGDIYASARHWRAVAH